MKAKCSFCRKNLKVKGAIIISPPHLDEEPDNEFVDDVSKYHICKNCWDKNLRPYIVDNFRRQNKK